jgi:hypothetical protein
MEFISLDSNGQSLYLAVLVFSSKREDSQADAKALFRSIVKSGLFVSFIDILSLLTYGWYHLFYSDRKIEFLINSWIISWTGLHAAFRLYFFEKCKAMTFIGTSETSFPTKSQSKGLILLLTPYEKPDEKSTILL